MGREGGKGKGTMREKKREEKVREGRREGEGEGRGRGVSGERGGEEGEDGGVVLRDNTGARVQELADLRIEDVKADDCPQVKLMGKGRKERVNPLWKKTAAAINQWLKAREQAGITSEHLFVNSHRQQLSRFGIAHIVSKYLTLAATTGPSLLL